jgi:hypothetical protein
MNMCVGHDSERRGCDLLRYYHNISHELNKITINLNQSRLHPTEIQPGHIPKACKKNPLGAKFQIFFTVLLGVSERYCLLLNNSLPFILAFIWAMSYPNSTHDKWVLKSRVTWNEIWRYSMKRKCVVECKGTLHTDGTHAWLHLHRNTSTNIPRRSRYKAVFLFFISSRRHVYYWE